MTSSRQAVSTKRARSQFSPERDETELERLERLYAKAGRGQREAAFKRLRNHVTSLLIAEQTALVAATPATKGRDAA